MSGDYLYLHNTFTILIESWLTDKTYDSEILSATSYLILRHYRVFGLGGGVAAVYKIILK